MKQAWEKFLITGDHQAISLFYIFVIFLVCQVLFAFEFVILMVILIKRACMFWINPFVFTLFSHLSHKKKATSIFLHFFSLYQTFVQARIGGIMTKNKIPIIIDGMLRIELYWWCKTLFQIPKHQRDKKLVLSQPL